MTRVLMIGMTKGVGGIETFICNIKKYISSDISMDFLVHQNIDERYYKDILTNNSNIYKVTGIKENFIKYLKEIFEFYRENKYDVIHINECDAKMFFYAIPLLFDNKTKLIIHSHSTSTKNVIIHNILKFLQNKRANVKWACSDTAYEYMFGQDENKVIIHNGIDLNKFRFDKKIRETKKRELNLKNEIVFGSVARFTKEKNHEKIIDIFYEYNKKNKNSKLLLIGTGELQKNIKNKVKNLKIDDNVIFLNSRSDVNELLSVIDVFLLPSIYEGLPFVALEGQACSTIFFVSKNISKEIAITDLVHFIDLNEDANYWAKKIDENLKIKVNRDDIRYQEQIRKAGFDIVDVCKFIENEYKKK